MLVPIFFVLFIVAFVAYILKRDSEIDEGKSPWVVKVPNTNLTLTPSRWFWRKVRENKKAALIVIIACVFGVWFWL